NAKSRQKLEQRFDVIGEARHHATDSHAVIEARRQSLQMGEEIAPQIAQAVQHRARQHDAKAMSECRAEYRPERKEKAGSKDRMCIEQCRQMGCECLLAEIRCCLARRRKKNAVHHHAAHNDRSKPRRTCREGHAKDRERALPSIGRHPAKEATEKTKVEAACFDLILEYGVIARLVAAAVHAPPPVSFPSA